MQRSATTVYAALFVPLAHLSTRDTAIPINNESRRNCDDKRSELAKNESHEKKRRDSDKLKSLLDKWHQEAKEVKDIDEGDKVRQKIIDT